MRRPGPPQEIIDFFLSAYRQGAFPMADMPRGAARGGEVPIARSVRWYRPDPRAVLPLEDGSLHVPRTLRKRLGKRPFEFTCDRAFEGVIRACARPGPTRGGAWLDESLIRCYTLLHGAGHAHSVEATDRGSGLLLGGIYGVSIGGAFFAESMFSDIDAGGSGAASACLVTLWHHLRACGYELLDVQMANEHTLRFGVLEISGEDYLRRLGRAVGRPDRWRALEGEAGRSDSPPSGSGA